MGLGYMVSMMLMQPHICPFWYCVKCSHVVSISWIRCLIYIPFWLEYGSPTSRVLGLGLVSHVGEFVILFFFVIQLSDSIELSSVICDTQALHSDM